MDDGSAPYLAVMKSGTGNGFVTDSEGRINCGSVCTFSGGFGTWITLKAQADQSSVFTGWSGGGCSGTGECMVMLDTDKMLIPTFAGPSVSAKEPEVEVSDIATNEFTGTGPAYFNQHTSVGFTATNVTNTVSFAVVFQFLPVNPVFFKVVGSTWKQIYPTNECGGVTDVSLSGTSLYYTMALSSECNSNTEIPKTIIDPLVVGTMSYSGGSSSSNCFIATAAYGSYIHPSVTVLRAFRDRFLLSNSAGKLFVDWYYRVSPPIAVAVGANDWARASVKICLLPIVGFSLLCLKIGVLPVLMLLLMSVIGIFYGWYRRATRARRA